MMDAHQQSLCLLNMPELVLDKILSNIHNPSSVSRTCKYLYEIVCDMEKRRRVMYIRAIDVTEVSKTYNQTERSHCKFVTFFLHSL